MLLKFPNSLWRQCTRKCATESHSSTHNMISSTLNRRSNNRKYSTSRRNSANNKSDNLHKSNSIRVSGDNTSIDNACSDINSKLLANTPELLAYCLSVSTPLHPALGLFGYYWQCSPQKVPDPTRSGSIALLLIFCLLHQRIVKLTLTSFWEILELAASFLRENALQRPEPVLKL
jgi:hypothetical protein